MSRGGLMSVRWLLVVTAHWITNCSKRASAAAELLYQMPQLTRRDFAFPGKTVLKQLNEITKEMCCSDYHYSS